MINHDLSVLILSCDKNYDLSPWINKTCEHFLNIGVCCTLVTENLIDKYDRRINAIASKSNCFDERFKNGIKEIKTKYVLILLDDYYVHDELLKDKVRDWISVMKKNSLSALRISKLEKKFVRKKKIDKFYYLLTKIQSYEIDFHPTIWDKNKLNELICDRTFSPWDLEPLFSLFLSDKNACITKNRIEYDELVIKGCFFKKPYNKYCKNEYKGDKKIFGSWQYFKYRFRIYVYIFCPYWLFKLIRKTFRVKSISSEAQI